MITNACKYALQTTINLASTIPATIRTLKSDLPSATTGLDAPNPLKNRQSNTLGLKLIRLLAGKLKDTYDFTSNKYGTVFQLSFFAVQKKATVPLSFLSLSGRATKKMPGSTRCRLGLRARCNDFKHVLLIHSDAKFEQVATEAEREFPA
ncbi:hypothetical protein GCM10023091_00320 [Ravibacter arvi]|uniref:Uncharacterized protein n=1 Tax=Ravibacter arvi TaxID=2051041 RepID=A0ABP8LJ58_9BACT